MIPTYNRLELFRRALKSVLNQRYDRELSEIIVVDDGSTDKTKEFLKETPNWRFLRPRLKVHRFEENRGKIAAKNKGMEMAENDWICWLDSDDEYSPYYLETFNEAVNQFPAYEIFNCAFYQLDLPQFQHRHWDAFKPEIKDGKCLPFKSGQVTSGSFIFKRKLLEEFWPLPESKTAYGSEDSFAALCAKKWEGINALYGKNGEGQWLPFGNPFGEDYLVFFLLTRNHIPKAINVPLYVQFKKS